MAESESVKVSLDCTQNPRLKAEAWRLIYTAPEIHEWKQKPKGQFTMHIKSITESEGGIGQFTEHCIKLHAGLHNVMSETCKNISTEISLVTQQWMN